MGGIIVRKCDSRYELDYFEFSVLSIILCL